MLFQLFITSSYAEIYEAACQALKPANPDTKPTCISHTGAMVAYSGDRTG